MIAIDDVTHKPFSEAQFRQFVQTAPQRGAARDREAQEPHDRSIAALLVEEIPGSLWEQLEAGAAHDAEVHGRGTSRVHDVMLRLLRAYARVGLRPIESLDGDPLRR